jgi:hypothetical protein
MAVAPEREDVDMGDDSKADELEGARGRVEQWLEKHGVALDMQVARAFRAKLGESQLVWDVDLGRNYIDHDPETGLAKLRETDVVVRATKVLFGDLWISVWLAIECKSSKAEPWVFYRAAGRIDPWAQILSHTAWDAVIDERLVEANIGGWSGSPLLMATVRNCYAAASVSDPRHDRTRPNHARDAIMQAISAARGVVRDVPTSENQHHPTAALVIPIVVTAAPMFAVELTSDGHNVIETTREVVQVRHLPEDDRLRKVWVVNFRELDALADDLVELVDAVEYRH